MIHAEIIEWHDAEMETPPDTLKGESFLIALAEDNPAEWTSSRPVMAEYCFSEDSGWTVHDSWLCSNISVNGYVRYWAELPEIPECEL